ncbi:MAG: homoserine dehydrogenase [Marivirga sp.]|jgi:homoserine dehydrogenase
MKNVAIIGLGTVGCGVYEKLTDGSATDFKVTRVVVKDVTKERSISGYEPLLSTCEEVLSDDTITIVIELTNDEQLALKIALATLEKGKTFISGSKKMIAKNLKLLEETAERNKALFLYEAAVCGSVPIILLLQNYFLGNTPKKVRTIANGTSNYILSKLWQTAHTYTAIVQQAQLAGFAEIDPTDDVAGFDIRSKLTIIISNAFQINLAPTLIPCFGIQHIKVHTIGVLKAKGLKLKLIGEAACDGSGLSAFVVPVILAEDDPFFSIEGEQNAVEIENALSQNQLFSGKGAGRYPTTQAVLADLQATNSKRKNTLNKQWCQKIINSEVYFFYVDITLQQLDSSVEIISLTSSYIIVKATFEAMVLLSEEHEELFIARIPEEVYSYYFA